VTNCKLPSGTDEDEIIKQYGSWVSNQKNNYKNNENIMKDENIRKLWERFVNEYPQVFRTYEDVWKENLEWVRQYVVTNSNLPSGKDKDAIIKQYGSWVSTQKDNYKNNEKSMKDENIRKLWERFVNEYPQVFRTNEDVWKENLEWVRQYVVTNSNLPSGKDKDAIIKQYGSWVSNQKKNYKNNEHIMKDENIHKLWEGFMKEYPKLFKI
jgi:DNA-directed RNA polymerase subunit H (RpoH/RPB5)